ncbi:hypothetical protein ACFPOA_02165 [Lysobacter niabensis]|uniref:hypothetical protein n=1 Tax=Agrilutibacter niabensis TaxID=380628 RepID=UPI00360996FA
MRAACLVAALLLAPIARADDEQCRLALGRGWPPATENYGKAVEQLFAGDSQPALRFTLLPKTGVESGVLLIPGADGGDWTLRRAVADQRVHYWGPTQLELRTAQAPATDEASMPAAVATRLVDEWRHALSLAAPEGSAAPFSEGDTWLFVAGDLRASGLKPDCELGELLRDQIDLLIEASDEGDEKRQKRWRQLGESLDRMRQTVDGPPAPSESDAAPEKRSAWSLFK